MITTPTMKFRRSTMAGRRWRVAVLWVVFTFCFQGFAHAEPAVSIAGMLNDKSVEKLSGYLSDRINAPEDICFDLSAEIGDAGDASSLDEEHPFVAYVSNTGKLNIEIVGVDTDRERRPDYQIVAEKFILQKNLARMVGLYEVEVGQCRQGCIIFIMTQKAPTCKSKSGKGSISLAPD